MKATSVTINGVIYVPEGSEKTTAIPLKGMPYVIIRTYSAGVFAGYLEARNGSEVVVRNARRLWYWSGAASLSQLAMEGTKKPTECKFPCEVIKVKLLGVVEIIECTEEARLSINSCPIWQQ